MYLNLTLTFLFACLMASTSFAQLTTNDGNIYLRNQKLYGDNSSALFWTSNHSNYTQLILEDKENIRYGKVVGTGNGTYFGLMDGNNRWTFVAKKNDWTSLRVNNSDKMRILANGNVGVGTTSPGSKLTVVSSGTESGIASHSDAGNSHIPWTDGKVYLTGNELIFRTTGNINRMKITSNGNVGIGTLTPGNKLEVNGTIRSKEVKVELANWGDYVFYDDYQLPTLEEEEVYIEKNGHLSGFESAEAMGSELQLGDVAKRQQVKIEEMMLHLIDLKKQNDELKKEMKILKAKVEK